MPFIVAWIAGLILLPRVRKLAMRLGWVDHPSRRKIHQHPVPRIGGVAIFGAGLLGALPFLGPDSRTVGLLLASGLVFLLGLIDDIYDLSPGTKLLGQVGACLVLFGYGLRIEIVTDFIAGKGFVALGLLSYPLTMLWIIGLTNTINLIDGVDGLAGGIAFIALGTLLAVRLLTPHSQDVMLITDVLVISAAVMGSLLAFLRVNVYPARMFMGDSGAYFLGFLIAALAIAGAAKGSVIPPLVIPLITLGLPVLDVFLAILRRYFNKVPIFQADKEHLHHKLLRNGFSQSETTRFLWMVSTCFGLTAILTAGAYHRGIALTVVFLLIAMIFLTGIFFARTFHARRQR